MTGPTPILDTFRRVDRSLPLDYWTQVSIGWGAIWGHLPVNMEGGVTFTWKCIIP